MTLNNFGIFPVAKFTHDQIKFLARNMREKRESKKPFNLLTGAGCSKSAGIPLAGELIKEIHNKFGEECRLHLREDQMNDYGACMSCLPINDRRELLSKYLKNSKINWAHIAIASLMSAGFVSRVITFNFDSILARACSLLGLYPATYDFAAAATVNTDYIAPQAIIHLHGQGTGKSLLNSDDETKSHAENIRPLIRTTFQDSPLLVIGYSGSSDAVFPIISDEYEGREKLWWAGYTDNPDLPIANFINSNSKLSYYLGGCDADDFLIELAKELQCFPPELFRNPYGHLLNELDSVAEFPFEKSGSLDLLASLKKELVNSQQRHSLIKDIPELMMAGNWDAVISLSDPENPDHKNYLAWAYTMQGNELCNQGKQSKSGTLLENSFEKYQQAINVKPDKYETFNNWGIALFELAKIKGDDNLFQQSFDAYQKAINLRPTDSDVLNNWGVALFEMAKTKSDESIFHESFDKYQHAISISPEKYEIYNNWGLAFSELAKIKRDESIFQESFDKYQQAISIHPERYESYSDLGLALSELANIKCDESIFQKSFDEYQKALAIKHDAHDVIYSWGTSLFNLAKIKSDESIFQQCFEKYQQVIRIKPDQHEAFNGWGVALTELAKIKVDDSLFQQSFEKYEQAIRIKHDKYETLNNWGTALLEFAKIKCDDSLFYQSFDKYQQAVAINPNNHQVLNNWGFALYEFAKIKGEESIFQTCFRKYQQAVEAKPDKYVTFDQWGTALVELAIIKKDISLFQQSFDKYQKSIEIKPDYHNALVNWGSALLFTFHLTNQKKYLDTALDILLAAEKIDQNQVYNLACLYSLLNEKVKAKEKLYQCKSAKTLPDKTHLENDIDLHNIRNESWFKELVNTN